MRIVVLGMFCSLFFLACNNSKTSESTKEESMNVLGGDKDGHGCLGSAGYTWSLLKEDCIRVWEDGLTLLPKTIEESETVHAVFVLYSDDKLQIELFMPTEKESILLEKESINIFIKDTYRLDTETNTLYIDGVAAYQEEPML